MSALDQHHIQLQGVRVHNLQNLTLNIPHQALTVICGVSGSGKSSLAFDTLFAEGQRRYIETFSPYARQFLDRLERPAADRIEGLPPAIAIRQNQRSTSHRSTVGTRTEILDYLRLLFLRAADLICPDCNSQVQAFRPAEVVQWLLTHAQSQRAMLAFQPLLADVPKTEVVAELESLQQRGFTRLLYDDRMQSVDEVLERVQQNSAVSPEIHSLLVIVDRVRITAESVSRLQDSLEATFGGGHGTCLVLLPHNQDAVLNAVPAGRNVPPESASQSSTRDAEILPGPAGKTDSSAARAPRFRLVDGTPWQLFELSDDLRCVTCHRTFTPPVAESLNFNSVVGACSRCEGLGTVSTMTWDRVVPDESLSLREGAIVPWNTPAYAHELAELLALADDYQIPVDQPFSELNERQRSFILHGIPERNFGGLLGFHDWLVRHRYKLGVRVFLNQWRTWTQCPQCRGSRLNADADLLRLNGRLLAELQELELTSARKWLDETIDQLAPDQRTALQSVTDHVSSRLNFLMDCGLGYLTLNRAMPTLSGGEAQRVMLTAALGSGLINTLYVLDEPTTGLHGEDTQRVIQAARRLQEAGNTVVVVEHDPQFILAADEVIEIGPGAGRHGGQIVFQGTPQQLISQPDSPTGRRLHAIAAHPLPNDAAVRAGDAARDSDRRTPDGAVKNSSSPETAGGRSTRICTQWLDVSDVRCHNVQGLSVRLPLGVIGAMTGVSGSGKSSLLVDSIYPALCRRLGKPCHTDRRGTVGSLGGVEQLDDVALLDQQPLQRSSRSIPATWIGVFDDIRKLLAETHEAKKRNFSPGMFSFNSARGGRCPVCEGRGSVIVEMQFLADIETTCEECHGRRYRADVLEVRYRDRSVDDILNMTADEAFLFFTGQARIQQRLNAVRQAGLGYIQLGQPLSTLSGGEAQRLRIAALLAGVPLNDSESSAANRKSARISGSGRTLFILDEPSSGLHMQDVDGLMTCLNFLVQTGHSVIIIEHDDYLLRQTDCVIRMGPGAGSQGGKIVQHSCGE